MEPQFIIDRIDTMDNNINQRVDTMESNMKDHLSMCQNLCGTRLSHAESEITKLHQRLNNHAKSIDCVCKFKNEEEGFRKATKFYMSLMAIMIDGLGLIIAFYR